MTAVQIQLYAGNSGGASIDSLWADAAKNSLRRGKLRNGNDPAVN
ncbi:hypothetical protein FHR98_003133 [Limibacillus halophilus]|uniref:Uncharacterized protein n=1 Tax=Limibacillus halophilus TaxID=1579333 RepID=A0A839SWF5_9PROT|nr:hypothetical protein [Limibacillus halophilus]